MSLPKPVSQKAYDSINIRIADECETLANASMSDAALEEKILDGTRNCIAVSGDGTWKTRGHTSLVGVVTLIGAECGKVLDIEIMSSFCKVCDSFKATHFGPKYSVFYRNTSPFAKKIIMGLLDKWK
ncbi:uncharacterized protein TNCV_2940681 [Trichonephila clavipes]|nr:uncharacterized protein TNCV_2940681 [Trichonephila clavipes]